MHKLMIVKNTDSLSLRTGGLVLHAKQSSSLIGETVSQDIVGSVRMKGRCSCCYRIRDVQPMIIKRKYHTKTIRSGQICRSCWDGEGDSYPTVYFP